jgi:hypothetical protein
MKRMMFVLASACAMSVTPAYAQSDFWAGVTADVIGQTIANSTSGPYVNVRCMTGRAVVSSRQRSRVSGRVTEAMARYLVSAQTGEAANVTEAYAGGSAMKSDAWRLNGEAGYPTSVSDPLAHLMAASELAAPDHIVIGGNRTSAGAIWLVRDASGQTIGHYRGLFARARGRWGLSQLDLVQGDAAPEEFAPFCMIPGDIEEFVRTHDERGRPLPAPDVATSAKAPAEVEAPAEAEPAAPAPQ